jgi:hypothetical protein
MNVLLRGLSCWLGAALLAAPALAAEDLFAHPRSAVQVQTVLHAAMPALGQTQVLRGRFIQRKFLREIPRPLVSSGEFLLVRERGVWWHTQTPLESELTLDAGAPLLALFTLDLDVLARSFELFLMPSATHEQSSWLLGLRPRDAALSAWFEQATLGGDAQLERITLFESTGDRTEIDLDAAVQPLSSLSPVERQRFAPW